MAIDRIEVLVTDLPLRLQRETSSGTYDTGPSGTLLGKPVLVRIHADGISDSHGTLTTCASFSMAVASS